MVSEINIWVIYYYQWLLLIWVIYSIINNILTVLLSQIFLRPTEQKTQAALRLPLRRLRALDPGAPRCCAERRAGRRRRGLERGADVERGVAGSESLGALAMGHGRSMTFRLCNLDKFSRL